MPAPRFRTLTIEGWPSGVNNVAREDNLPQTQVREAVNVDLLSNGKIRRRGGYTSVLAETGFHSLTGYANRLFGVQDRKFYEIDFRAGTKTEVADLGSRDYVDYAELNNKLLVLTYNNLYEYDGNTFRTLHTEQPNGMPMVSDSGLYGLPAGEYQAAITFIREDGQESGAALAATPLTLSDDSSILVSNIPQPDDINVVAIRLYATRTSATELQFVRDMPVGTTSATVSNWPNGRALDTQFMQPIGGGSCVATHNAQVLVGRGKNLWYSPPFRFGLCNPADHYIPFATDITMVKDVDGGVFVGTEDRVVFLRGETMDQVSTTTADYDGVVPGTPATVPSSALPFLELGAGESVVVWWSTRGVMIVGLPNGTVRAVREGELSLPQYERGAIISREKDGVQQLVSALSGIRQQSQLAMTDSVDAIVYRKNVQV